MDTDYVPINIVSTTGQIASAARVTLDFFVAGNYLVKVAADGHVVYKWYHRLFLEAARSYFLSDKPFTDSLHRDLANYFNGR